MERPRENRSVLMRYVLMAVILFAPALAAQSAPGFTWTVGPANLQGTSPIFGSIQAAIAAAANGDTVLVYPGTYYESIDLLGKNLTVVSAQGPTLTTINGGQANAVVRCVSGEARAAVIGGFTITNGRAAFGGGFLILNAQPTIRRCRVVANTALTAGGGVYMSFGVPRFENCDFASNTALNYGGGAATDYGSAPEFYECSFTGNGAAFGGAVGNNLADPVLDRCTLNSNVASQGGGGVDSFGGQVRIYDSTISQNSAPIGAGWRDFSANSLAAQVRFIDNFASNFGGGLAAYSGSMRIENGLFHGNSAPWGGAIFDYASGLQVRLTTITANSAGISGGAWASVSGGPSLVENSILWANTPNEIAPSSAGGYPTTTFRYSNIAGGRSGSGNIALDPLFADPVALDFHLTAASPCRDAGAAWYAPPPLIDADGNCRFPRRRDRHGIGRVLFTPLRLVGRSRSSGLRRRPLRPGVPEMGARERPRDGPHGRDFEHLCE